MRDFDRYDRYSANIGEMMERMGIEFDEEFKENFGPALHLSIMPFRQSVQRMACARAGERGAGAGLLPLRRSP